MALSTPRAAPLTVTLKPVGVAGAIGSEKVAVRVPAETTAVLTVGGVVSDGGGPPPPSGGPSPVGTKVGLVVSSRRSTRKPSSRIHRLRVWAPAVATDRLATGPSMVLANQVHALRGSRVMRSALAGAVPSMPMWAESLAVLVPYPRSQTYQVPALGRVTAYWSSGLVVA